MYKLYLDDIRVPTDSYKTINESWVIVRSYADFVAKITADGLPEIVSFDHDLSDEHVCDYILNVRSSGVIDYNKYSEKTGMSCAKWLVEYCMDNNAKLPEFFIHSANPVGAENIRSYLDSYQRSCKINQHV